MAHRPSFGRTLSIRGLDMFDTPPVALAPLFVQEPLLRGVTAIAEPFAGRGNLAVAMRARGIVVHASDIFDRGCADSRTIDFFDVVEAPCPVLVSNPPYSQATALLEHAFAIGFGVVIFLLTTNYLHTGDRRERIHKRGHLARVHVLAERGLQGVTCTTGRTSAAGGKKAEPAASTQLVCVRSGPFRPRDNQPRISPPPQRENAMGRRARASAPRPGFARLTAYV